MNEHVLSTVRRIAADIFHRPLDEITAHSTRDSLRGWDSLAHLNLMPIHPQGDRQRWCDTVLKPTCCTDVVDFISGRFYRHCLHSWEE